VGSLQHVEGGSRTVEGGHVLDHEELRGDTVCPVLQLLLLVVVAAMAMYVPWEQPLLAPAQSTLTSANPASAQPPNDWLQLFASILYRLGGDGGERHPA
jgi:hypothetical protein